MTGAHPDRPNILMIVSDEERRNGWLDGVVDLPAHERLRADGLAFDRYFTHTSPCSPSRASLYTGQYISQHGVVDNVNFPAHVSLDPAIPTTGARLRAAGYESGYVGKWHLSDRADPDLAAHGFSGWSGNDKHFTGSAWTGRHFDPVITDQALAWLDRATTTPATPWFLTVALVNPHDIMWFPVDQPEHQAAHPRDKKMFDFMHDYVLGGEVPVTPPPTDFPRLFDSLPANFHDDLRTKPEIQRRWQEVRNTEHFVGAMDLADTHSWLRQLDYYAWLHQRLDESLARLLGKLDQLGIYDETAIVYTSDHGDAAGSHGLRAKLPCIYDEVMGVPLIIKPSLDVTARSAAKSVDGGGGGTSRDASSDEPASHIGSGSQEAGREATGRSTEALSSHVDLAVTVVKMGGGDSAGMSGTDLAPVIADPRASVRDAVFFAQDSAQSDGLAEVRYALRGFFDGTTKYARYYGQGGGVRRDGTRADTPKRIDADADFAQQEHEWYETGDDPHELANRARDPGLGHATRKLFDRLIEFERSEGLW